MRLAMRTAIALLLTLPAGLAPAHAAPPDASRPLRVALEFDPAPLDPATDGSYTNRIVTTVMCDSLIDFSPQMKFIPELATSWAWSPDRRSLTLHLRPGVTYQDGTKLDAASIQANLQRYQTAPYSIRKSEMSAITGSVVVNPETIRITLSHPYAPLLATLANRVGTPYSPRILALPRDAIAAHPVCAGPFAFKNRVAQDHITLTRWPGYWNAAAIHLPGIVFHTVTSATVRKTDLEAKALDIADHIAPTDVAEIRGRRDLVIARTPSLGYSLIEINVGNGKAARNPLGRDARVRRAFSLAIDRGALNQVAFNGQYVPSNQMEAPGSPYFDSAYPVPSRNVAEARKLLAAAGYKHVTVTLQIGTDPLDRQAAEIIQSMVKDAGFDLKLVSEESAGLVGNARSGNFQAVMLLWSGRADPDGNMPIWLTCKGFTNWGHFCSPAFDRLITRGAEGNSLAQRKPLYDRAVAIFERQAPDIVLYHYAMIWGLSAKVHGFHGRPDGLWRPEGMTVAP
ncbi:MAG: ABC transporter substrate-binding protein [Rhodospirillales bacterium]|nr:ABC transporter substrate-binding protein [Rhodospirillales bacterium]